MCRCKLISFLQPLALLLSEALWHLALYSNKDQLDREQKERFHHSESDFRDTLPPTRTAESTTPRGTPSTQPSAARHSVGVACVSLNTHEVQCDLFKQTKQWVVKDRQK